MTGMRRKTAFSEMVPVRQCEAARRNYVCERECHIRETVTLRCFFAVHVVRMKFRVVHRGDPFMPQQKRTAEQQNSSTVQYSTVQYLPSFSNTANLMTKGLIALYCTAIFCRSFPCQERTLLWLWIYPYYCQSMSISPVAVMMSRVVAFWICSFAEGSTSGLCNRLIWSN